MRGKPISIALVVAVLALIVAGCGSSSDDGTGGSVYGGKESTTKPTTTGSAPAPAVVTVHSVPKLGKVVVNSKGLTLYDFHKDKGTKSSCYGECAAVWPPMTTEGQPTGQMGVPTAKLGTTKRKDGTTQVTFAGHPLYTYVEDSKPGEANGNDFSSFGAQWYALEPNGAEPED